MTREEARIELQAMKDTFEEYEPGESRCQMALKVALTALRSVSREQVEKVWRGEWIIPTVIGGRAYRIPHCSACSGVPCGTDENTKFCAHCGAPMTDEAVQMVMERLEVMKDGNTAD